MDPIYMSRGRLAAYLDMNLKESNELLKSGVTIVDVCTPDKAIELRTRVWDELEGLGTGIDRNDTKTWRNDRWFQSLHGSLVQGQKVGLREGVCEARLECVHPFKKIFKGVPVNSSFDGISVGRPDSQKRVFKKEEQLNKKYGEGDTLVSSWLHIDQANNKPDCMEHIQGALALTNLTESEQRTQFIIPKPDSDETIQMFRDRFLDAFPPTLDAYGKISDADRADWVSFGLKNNVEDTDPIVIAKRKWLIENGHVYTPTLEAGQMVIWDSGVPHASMPGPLPSGNSSRDVRISIFSSMLPAAVVTEEERKVRNNMLDKTVTSTHRVTAVGKSGKILEAKFSDMGRTYGKEPPSYSYDSVVRASKRQLEESGDDKRPDSLANKTQRLCAGDGL